MSYEIHPMSDELIEALDNADTSQPVIKAVELDVRWADDELALSDFFMDIETILEDCADDLSDSTPDLLRQLLDAINVAWKAPTPDGDR